MKKNKTILIIGATGGIGSCAAKKFLKKGENVCATYRKKEKIKQVFTESEIAKLSFYYLDVCNEGAVTRAIKKIIKDNGNIDAVIYAPAAKLEMKQILNTKWSDYAGQIDLYAKGLFSTVKILAKCKKSALKTKFIVISSESCFGKPPKGLSHYVTAKYAQAGLTKTLAVAMLKENMTFNLVSPGMVKTDLLANFPPKAIELAASMNPMKKIATPADIVSVIEFLASEESDYLNGANILVDGGNVMA